MRCAGERHSDAQHRVADRHERFDEPFRFVQAEPRQLG
jgi:hypothetical protein